MISSIFTTILAIYRRNKTIKSINDMTCALMKFLYEIKNKPFKESSFLGFENVNNLFTNISKNSNLTNIKLSTLTNSSKDCKIQSKIWVSL